MLLEVFCDLVLCLLTIKGYMCKVVNNIHCNIGQIIGFIYYAANVINTKLILN